MGSHLPVRPSGSGNPRKVVKKVYLRKKAQVIVIIVVIDREFVTSTKKNSRILTKFSKLKKFVKIPTKNSLNAPVGVAFQWNSLLI